MRCNLGVNDNPHVGRANHGGLIHARAATGRTIAIYGFAARVPAETARLHVSKRAGRLGATRCLRRPFKPARPLDVTNECLPQAVRITEMPLILSEVAKVRANRNRKIGWDIEPREDSRVHYDSGRVEQLKPNAQARPDGAARVLVVDDDPMVCMAIEVYLERHDFQVTIADGGEAGLRALESEHFDLMIVDIFMPHMRGFESIRIFHERAPAIPLIAMSGYAFANLNSPAPDFLRMALELGASRCLRKPFTPAALLTVINECLSESRSRANASRSR